MVAVAEEVTEKVAVLAEKVAVLAEEVAEVADEVAVLAEKVAVLAEKVAVLAGREQCSPQHTKASNEKGSPRWVQSRSDSLRDQRPCSRPPSRPGRECLSHYRFG